MEIVHHVNLEQWLMLEKIFQHPVTGAIPHWLTVMLIWIQGSFDI